MHCQMHPKLLVGAAAPPCPSERGHTHQQFACTAHVLQLEPRQKAARAVFEELLAFSNAGRLVLKVADERFPEELQQPLHESWL